MPEGGDSLRFTSLQEVLRRPNLVWGLEYVYPLPVSAAV